MCAFAVSVQNTNAVTVMPVAKNEVFQANSRHACVSYISYQCSALPFGCELCSRFVVMTNPFYVIYGIKSREKRQNLSIISITRKMFVPFLQTAYILCAFGKTVATQFRKVICDKEK